MTLRIKSSDSIANVPVLLVRKVLKRLSPDSFFCFEYFEEANLGKAHAKRLGQALLAIEHIEFDRKLDGKRWFKLTEKGREFVRSSAAQRIKRKTADEALAALIDRAKQINASPDYLVRVTGLAVFGSYLTDSPDLGDLDIGVSFTRKFEADSWEEWLMRCKKHFKKSGRHSTFFLDYAIWPELQARLYLKLRKRTISLHGIDELKELAAQNPSFEYKIVFGSLEILREAIGVAPKADQPS